jgi:hypothetical protein
MKLPRSYITTGATISILIALISLVVWLQKNNDERLPPFRTKLHTTTRDLLPESVLPYVTFGFTNIITDIYWIRAVQDFTVWDGKDPYYLNYFRNISVLDPTFEYPYFFSILIVTQDKDIETLDKVAAIAERGIKAIPTSWKIPFYLGTKYYLVTKNYEPAEKYLGIAASRKDAPDGVYLTYSSFVSRTVAAPMHSDEDYKTVQSLIKVIYNNTDDETIKKMAGEGLQENLITQMLKKGIIAYKEKYKRYPKNTNEMLVVNFISLPQGFKDNFIVEISQRDGSFKVVGKE